MEDFALRFTARRARKWSAGRVANTALGSISFLALEAIGGAITLSYGFANAVAAILVVGVILCLTAVPISYHAARAGVDIDLLTRGAGFGYIGSTITSLIYASFTFIFFALEGAILSFALEICFGVPLAIGYLLNALVVIPLVSHGFTRITAFQKWTQAPWLLLHTTPFVLLAASGIDFAAWTGHEGRLGDGGFDPVLFAIGSGVVFSLAAQIGEQVDFLRFLPEPRTARQRRAWWVALLAAGPGWAVLGTCKMLAGSLLAVLALEAGLLPGEAAEPTRMYLAAFETALPWPEIALVLTGLFVVISQLKINVTNAYAGSIAWSNFFSRLTHSHPGRVVWLVFNVAIALMLMEFGVFGALENTLGLYSLVAVAWVGALVADLVINKPLGLSPPGIEFRRAHLYAINPVGVGAMSAATLASLLAYGGLFGETAEAMSSFIALGTALTVAPLIAWATDGRYYLARQPLGSAGVGAGVGTGECVLCGHRFDSEDMADCPFHRGQICSLCCTLEASCADRCKPVGLTDSTTWRSLLGLVPATMLRRFKRRDGLFAGIAIGFLGVIGAAFLLIHEQVSLIDPTGAPALRQGLFAAFSFLVLVVGVAAWLHVLALESRVRAMRESERTSDRLRTEIDAHGITDAALQKAKEDAEAANEAKSRYVVGISHELRTPLNSILGYAQLMENDPTIPAHRQSGVQLIRRSAEHLGGLIEGLLDISQIEAGRMQVYRNDIPYADFLGHIVAVFRMQAADKGLTLEADLPANLPFAVRGDEKRLRQILMNLLSNAVRYTDSGSVRFSVRYSNEIAVFIISDTGRGIAESERERIFKPFQRIEDPRAPVAGTGLGLTISLLMTEMLGGELTLTSEVGQGSCFTVRLMLPRLARASLVAQRPAAFSKGYHGPRRRIMVVDDNSGHRQLIRDALEPAGFELAMAETAEIALLYQRTAAPDLFLVDVALPGMDGWELVRRLRADEGLRTPILMVSAHAQDKDRDFGLDRAHDGFIAKPIRIDALFHAIGDALGLTWSGAESGNTQSPEPRGGPPDTRPSAALMGALVDAASIHHTEGVRAVLRRIAANELHAQDFVRDAEGALARFDFDAIRRLAEEMDA